MKANWQSGACHQELPFLCSMEQCDPQAPDQIRSPDTYLDSSIAYGQNLGWNVSFPECSWALLLQNLLGRLEDSVVFGIGVTWTQAFNLELGIKV